MIEKERQEIIQEIARFITDHKGEDTVVLDVSEVSGWADAFIISTVNSLGHLRGLARELWDVLNEKGVQVINRHKQVGDDGWELIDCGDIVIHLMGRELREFYNLEKLWSTAEKVEFLDRLEKAES